MNRAALLQASRRGEASSIEELIRRHRGWLRAKIANNFTRRSCDVDDLEQETWIRVVKLLPTWEGDDDKGFSGWLKSIAQRTCMGFYSRRPKAQLEDRRATLEEVPSWRWESFGSDPEHTAIEHQRMERVQSIVDGLDPRDAKILIRCDLRGVDQRYVAPSMHMSKLRVRHILWQTRKEFMRAAMRDPALAESLSYFKADRDHEETA